MMNLDMTTGCSFEIKTADLRYASKSLSAYTTFIAAPLKTYDGRIRTG